MTTGATSYGSYRYGVVTTQFRRIALADDIQQRQVVQLHFPAQVASGIASDTKLGALQAIDS